MNLHLDWCSHAACKYSVEHWHYSRTLPVPPLLKIGVWEHNIFKGSIIFSRGTSSNLTKPYGLTQYEACELTRVALNKHDAPVSKMLSYAIKMLKKKENIKLIISFADPNEGHHGGIYQATNWIYTGITNKTKEYIYKGKKYHSRQVSEKGYNIQMGRIRKCPRPSQCEIIVKHGKYRYLMPLTKEMREKILPLSKPYPKCLDGVTGSTTSIQEDNSGSNPTSRL